MTLIPGDFRHSITLHKLSVSKDDYGSAKEVYAQYKTLRCAVKYLSGTKGIDLEEVFASQTLQFTVHYREFVETTMRVKFRTKFYRILHIAETGFREGLQINCELIND